MDIIDVVLARALTPQGQIQTYAAAAQQSVTKATQAVNEATQAAETAINTLDQLTTISEDITTAAHNEIDKLAFDLLTTNTSSDIEKTIKVTYPSQQEENLTNIVKYYKSTGYNEDGTMTQKAITQALKNSGGGISNLGPENAGHIVIVDNDGNIASSTNITEEDLAEILNKESTNLSNLIFGLQINYDNYTYQRLDDADPYIVNNFNISPMYGGRKRCLVNDNGTIVAFYGQQNYNSFKETKQYQEMVYQPKFYYSRVPINTQNLEYGTVIRSEIIKISSQPLNGFSVHPLFINELGQEVDYVLLSAYEGSVESNTDNSYTDKVISNFSSQKLASVHGAKPISGLNNELNVQVAEQLAQNRGSQWHITNLQYESAMQILELIEFGTLNMQEAFESGISEIESSMTANNSAITGSTLGNASFETALETTFTINGEQVTYNTPGRRAISYRGIENPWGDTWRLVGGVKIVGNGARQGGETLICNNYNYDYTINTNYNSLGFYLPNSSGWISGFGYNNPNYDWAFIPIECGSSANSLAPVGDRVWVTPNLSSVHTLTCGGSWAYSSANGPFYYGCDRGISQKTSRMNARLMYLPHISDSNYSQNIERWNTIYNAG